MAESTKQTWIELNPQQELFLKNFLDPNSETFSNYTQSAIKAGYSKEYGENISHQMPKWLDEALEDSTLVRKALDNLSEFLGDRENTNARLDATKFTLTRLNKSKFSERVESTGKDGKDLPTPIINIQRDAIHTDNSVQQDS
jgi:hypothetical protein